MRIDWIPYSAAALVVGATALSVGAVLMPSGGGVAAILQMADDESGRWLAVAVLYFLAGVTLTIGMPSILTLFKIRGARLGLTGTGVYTIGCIGLAGFAMLLVFFRSLAVTDAIKAGSVDRVSSELGFTAFVTTWVAAFYLGELLLAVALLRGDATPRWIPALLILHVVLFPISDLLPDDVQSLTVLLITVALSGIGITANQYASRHQLV